MIYLDFEYNDNQVLLCCAEKTKKGHSEFFEFDFREDKDTDKFCFWLYDNIKEVFVSYSASAEVTSFLRLGIDPSLFTWVDLMVECRMITMSMKGYFTSDPSFVGQLRALLKRDVVEQKEHKEAMIALILGQDEWSSEEWDSIVKYCWSDVYPMKELMQKILELHAKFNHPYTIDHAASRGEFIRMAAEMDFESLGFPVYGGNLQRVYNNRERLKDAAVHSLPFYFRSIFKKDLKKNSWILKRNLLMDLIKSRGWEWKLTESGAPCLETDYLKALKVEIPEVAPLYQVRKTLLALNGTDMRELESNGYVKPKTFTFTAVTGRNGLRQTSGYLLNLPKWMHKMIKPHPGMCIVSSDWSQQEVGLAAALSGDEKLRAAYESGDIYLALGKMAGEIPENGTKATHSEIRDIFKALQLALAYGKGVRALSRDLYGIMQKNGESLHAAEQKANQVYKWHKATFKTYWDWAAGRVRLARKVGWIESEDHWVEWVDSKTRETQLLNFPSQSGGAVMMRTAYREFYKLWKEGKMPPVLCSQHDAFYFNVEEERLEEVERLIKQVMSETGVKVANICINSDTHVYTHEEGFKPAYWSETFDTLWTEATKDHDEIL